MKIFHYKDSDYSGKEKRFKLSPNILSLIRKTSFFVRDFEIHDTIPSHSHHYNGIKCKKPFPPPWNAQLAVSAMMDKRCEIEPTLSICIAPGDCFDEINMPKAVIAERIWVPDTEKSPFYEIIFRSNEELFDWMTKTMPGQVVDNKDIKAEFERRTGTGKFGLHFDWRSFDVSCLN